MLVDGSECVHVVANGMRFRLDLASLTIDALVASKVPASTIQFSTQHSPTTLKNSLVANIRQAMLN